MAQNTICHVEIATKDGIKASEFYQNLFGWRLHDDMGSEYIMFQPETGPGGAFMKSDDYVSGTNVVIYVEVDDIDACLQKALELGGQLEVPNTEIPNVGWFAHFRDLDGNKIGLYKSLKD